MLQNFIITGEAWEWFKYYLVGHRHCVNHNGFTFYSLAVRSGILRGVFGHNVVSDLCEWRIFPCVLHSQLVIFADDNHQCLKELSSYQESWFLQLDLDLMKRWCSIWNMSFNAKQCAVLRFGPSAQTTSYFIDQNPISYCTVHKDLGVLFTNTLSWSPHCSCLVAKAYTCRSLGLIRRFVPFNSDRGLKRSLHLTLVGTHPVYCSPIWRPYLIEDTNKFEKLQHRATNFLVSADWITSLYW